MKPQLRTITAAALFLAAPAFTLAQGYGPGYGPGMMGGYGPGWGGGPGMMGGYGPGYGPGYGWRFGALNLSDEQRAKIDELWQQGAKQRWDLMGELQQEQYKLNELLASDTDQATIDKAYQAVSNTRKQMIDIAVNTRKQIDQVLTPEQRRQLAGGRVGPRGGASSGQ